VDPEIVPALFGPFRRDRPDRTASDGGFGLGLSIVLAVVEAHHGSIEVTAPDRGGLEIAVSFAAVPAPMESAGEPRAFAAVASGGRWT
jgi:signal transduction histidine kinase